ncbi:hypothetical protein ETT51_01245 [Streptococcus pyogenes]|nr:hypothetical protein ETT51_01245 [Streptococcus pyogenes]
MDVFWAESQHFNYLMGTIHQMNINHEEKKILSNADLLSVMSN